MSYDPGKKRRGRKRCLLVDTLGFPVAVEILPAATHDWMAGLALLSGIRGAPRDGKPSAILADHSFHHPVVHGLARYGRRRLVIGALEDQPPHPPIPDGPNRGLRIIPRRWVIERTNAWMSSCRRLNREHECTTYSHEAFVWLAVLRLALRRLAPPSKRDT